MRRRRSFVVLPFVAFVTVPLATLAMSTFAPLETTGESTTMTATGASTSVATGTTTTTSVSESGGCRWLCGEDQCRLDVPSGVTCGDDIEVVDVVDDPGSELCEPDADEEPTYLVFPQSAEPYVGLADGTEITGDCDPWTTADGEGSLVCAEVEPMMAPMMAYAMVADGGAGDAGDGGAGDAGDGGKPKKKVLLTTFCEFLDITDNPTKRIRERLEKAVRDKCGADLDLSSVCLDVKPGAIRQCKVKDRIVISLGVCPDSEVRIETEAQNCFVDYGQRPLPPKVCVTDGGKPTVCGPKPPDGLIPCKVGGYPVKGGGKGTAGDFVCNATYYWTCTQEGCVPYFIHIPNIKPEEDEKFIEDMAGVICKIIQGAK